ncbi:hypothetical protein JAB1_46380 [Janthinobacterium sp. MP5059B]|uniref:hypothetical protein n=1 Tax=Janthinobacterium sp. MP5059B TaxID=1766683 RepID=UPI000873A934|nr:hypothetical protein [Janthinobacterium sp. MP5059B]OEZ46700.1 hypothetical protein JAB1_46380 [Janthinobacterium sp. MP5059B]
MADDNIFQQYLRPPKSVMEYTAEYDAADSRKNALRQNALELAAGQQKYSDGVQSRQRADQLRQALMGLPQGATDDQRIQAMRGTASPEGFAAADALDKSLIERRKGTAAADKDDAETAVKKLAQSTALHNFQAQKLAMVQSPEDALAWADESRALGLFSKPGQYEQGIARIQAAAQDPRAFAQWKADAMRGGQSVTEQFQQELEQLKQREQVRQFGITDQRIKSEGDANRAVTVSGQNKVDARARESASQGRVPNGYRANPDGTLAFIPGGPADPAIVKGKPTEFEGKSAIFGARAEEADKILNLIDYRPAAVNAKRSAEGFPLIGGALGAAANKFSLTENDQKAEQAQRDFVNAVLRQESGAAIAASEFDNAVKQYFPQPGDSAGVIAQKSKARKTTIQGLKRNAGNSAFTADSGAAKPSLNDIFK